MVVHAMSRSYSFLGRWDGREAGMREKWYFLLETSFVEDNWVP